MRWYSPADVMDRAGAMCALIGRCRFGRPTGGGGIEGSNPHEPVSSDQYGRHRCHPRGWQGLGSQVERRYQHRNCMDHYLAGCGADGRHFLCFVRICRAT